MRVAKILFLTSVFVCTHNIALADSQDSKFFGQAGIGGVYYDFWGENISSFGAYLGGEFGWEFFNRVHTTFGVRLGGGQSKASQVLGVAESAGFVISDQSLFEINHSFSTQQRADFNSFALGFIIQAKQEGKFPALLLGGSADVANKTYLSQTQNMWQYGKGYSAFALSFYTIDPLVFLLQANARFNLPQDFENIHFNLADMYSLSPMVYFAINPFVSLNAGVRYQYSTRAYANDRIQAQSSSVGYIFGVAYEIKSRLILFASAESFKSAFYSSDTLLLMLSYRI